MKSCCRNGNINKGKVKMGKLSEKQIDRINHIYKFMEWDNLTDAEHNLLISFSARFSRSKFLSERQIEILENIFERRQ